MHFPVPTKKYLDCESNQQILNGERILITIVASTSISVNYVLASWNNIFGQVRELVDKATNIVMNYTETEAKVSKLSIGCICFA